MLIVALFVMAPNCEQAKCPSVGKELNNGIIFSTKKNKILIHAVNLMDIKDINLGEKASIKKLHTTRYWMLN